MSEGSWGGGENEGKGRGGSKLTGRAMRTLPRITGGRGGVGGGKERDGGGNTIVGRQNNLFAKTDCG